MCCYTSTVLKKIAVKVSRKLKEKGMLNEYILNPQTCQITLVIRKMPTYK